MESEALHGEELQTTQVPENARETNLPEVTITLEETTTVRGSE